MIEATSKEQEGESTQTKFDPLLSLVSPDLKAICSQLLSKYPETIRDTSKWTYHLGGFSYNKFGLSYPNCSQRVERIV